MTYNEQLQLFAKPGVLGFYQSCEVTICSLLDQQNNAYNLYTLLVFESKKTPEKSIPRFLTHKNEYFGNKLRLVVVQYHISIEAAFKFYCDIQANTSQVNTPLGFLIISSPSPLLPTFVPANSTQTILMNRILKNNFCGGSMIMEWFGQKNNIQMLLKEEDLQRVTLRIRDLLPIDLFTVSDRIGNIIFQLPEQLAFCKLSGSKEHTNCTIIFDSRVKNTTKYLFNTMTDYDHTLIGFQLITCSDKHEQTITLNETGGPYVITLMDSEYHIPILQQTTSMMRMISSIITFNGNLDSVRTISFNNHTEKITINSSQRITAGRPEYHWKKAIQQRHYQKRMSELTINKEFVRYGKRHSDPNQGLLDLRKLMNAPVDTKVCLWDPYLSADDLLKTWYFTNNYGLELRAITSNKIQKRKNISLDTWIDQERKILIAGSNQYGINLQWRIQHKTFGFSFHDRFLILLPPDEETPKVWSLGTSVNSFGKTHHVLQLVSNPGYIADAFEELWAELDNPSCQIWNSKERR